MKYILLLLVGAGLAGCAGDNPRGGAGETANPAAVYCLKRGGTLIPVSDAGGQSHRCKLPTGEVLDEWLLFRRDHS
ncbi:DUF333 domain-containing protein [Shimwellia blattae]|uniref:Conserved outer membrane protein n=1 Tax=Shimwellia blattae (strain ATCC 29907 / DSM 4481 / JCM 1650 / NBRC 105725 / CDC 9005-74) TaxID=630626 RepID=I2BA97_SHIBC|nr:DUF333 domain-containing protein [Shimwellia blattae]AFJ47451.1 conserved outer membrane protein [Shimwellia blattae DSM 4481 = NBRC 105725]GAB80357.1 hypothetical protein YoaF [Shimwellia blattae DSM 4481 = NBRC 105725]VDY64949.1 Putative hemolysin [Shimwellia blattae]VEC23174.1 Putative hemolysin [Shimwellia blattae]